MDFMLTEFTDERQAPIYSSSFTKDTSTLLSSRTADKTESEALPPECDNGNVEYKAKLCDLSTERIHHLTTQMKWRLREGQGEAIYEIGVADNGCLTGIVQSEMDESLKTLFHIAESINASFNVLSQRCVATATKYEEARYVTEILVRKVPDNQPFIEIRLAILGSAEAGKSTLSGVLSRGELDNGKGSARLNVFRYLHEFQSGKTSSVCLDLIGFGSDGQVLDSQINTTDEIIEKSTKLMTLIDLAGDRKYINTTIYGLCGYNPHYCALVVSATTGPTAITKEHACLAMALNISTFVIITKADTVTEQQLDTVISRINRLITTVGLSGETKLIANTEEAIASAAGLQNRDIVPVITVSSVTGFNIDLLKGFLNVLPPIGFTAMERKTLAQKSTFFQIEEVFRVPRVGIVVCGILNEGILCVGDRIKIGPNRLGQYQSGRVGSIRRNKQPVFSINPGEAASVAINFDFDGHSNVTRGMVLIAEDVAGTCCWEFETKFFLFYHPTSALEVGFQGTIYIGSLCRTAIVVDVDTPSGTITPCTWTTVRFRFYGKPEHVEVNAPLIFRERKTRAMGEVTGIFDEISDKES
uniref:Tr-type G domain-containing protein n=1 Tax=Panagrellus redivivus TaxID=6233 RepID=A0A7E4W4Q5_PANRE